MPKYEGVADVLVLKEFVLSLSQRCDILREQGLDSGHADFFLHETAPRALRDLEQHPLGDKRPYITRLLNQITACERDIVNSENYRPT